jgi:hypothetical protein
MTLLGTGPTITVKCIAHNVAHHLWQDVLALTQHGHRCLLVRSEAWPVEQTLPFETPPTPTKSQLDRISILFLPEFALLFDLLLESDLQPFDFLCIDLDAWCTGPSRCVHVAARRVLICRPSYSAVLRLVALLHALYDATTLRWLPRLPPTAPHRPASSSQNATSTPSTRISHVRSPSTAPSCTRHKAWRATAQRGKRHEIMHMARFGLFA